MKSTWRRLLLVLGSTVGGGDGSDVGARIAELIFASAAANTSFTYHHQSQPDHDARRVLWAQGTGALDEAPQGDVGAAGGATEGKGSPRGVRRLAPAARGGARAKREADVGGGEEALRGDMPRWKQDMLKNKTQTQWKKWLEKDATLKDPGYRGKGTEASSESGDVWKECGGMPRSRDALKHTPNLGILPK